MAETKKVDASVEKVGGRQLVDASGQNTKVDFSFSHMVFASVADAKEKGRVASEDDILQMLNAKEKAKERAKAQNKAVSDAGYEIPNDDAQKLLRDMIRTLEASKQFVGKEREMAEKTLGTTYDDSLTLAPKVKTEA